MPRAVMLALTEPQARSQDNDYNSWYDHKHLHDVVGIPGVVAATRYRMVQGIELLPGASEVPQRYLAVYELEASTEAELAEFAEELKAALSDGRADIHPTMNMQTLGAAFALPITERLERPSAGAGEPAAPGAGS
jgi:hypothetical protein